MMHYKSTSREKLVIGIIHQNIKFSLFFILISVTTPLYTRLTIRPSGVNVQYSLRVMKNHYDKTLDKEANLTVQAFIHLNPSQLLAPAPPIFHHTSLQSPTTINIFCSIVLLKFKHGYLPVPSTSRQSSIISNIQIFLNGTSCRLVKNYCIIEGKSVAAYQSTRRNILQDLNIQ